MKNRYTHVACIQAGSTLFDTPATLDRCQDLLQDAVRQLPDGAPKLVVFPEAFLGGYPKGHHFGAPVGSRSDEGRDWFQRYHQSAITIPGPETDTLSTLALEHKTTIIIGVIERDGCTLYCTALCFNATGKLVGKRRKLMPTAAERVIWGFGDGSTLDIFDTQAGRLSAVICWENYMPMLRMSQYAQSPDIWCAPTVDDRPVWTSLMQTIALEGRCFVASASQFLQRRDGPEDFHPVQGDKPETVLINGGSVIISPLGEVLAGPVFGKETIITATIDHEEIVRGKMDFDVTGHYARPDIFSLIVNQEHQSPVNTIDEEPNN